MNPFDHEDKPSDFFGRMFQGLISKKSRPKRTKSKQDAHIKKRRMKNKMGYKSRRKNIILAQNLHHKLKG